MMNHILIVEDEKIVREGLARALSHSYITYQACNCIEALEILNSNNEIMVVLSDLKVPETEGFDMLKKIQSVNEEIKVIFLTAFFSAESVVEAMRRGAFDYITKPVDLRKLQATIKNAVGNIESGQNPIKNFQQNGGLQ